MKDETNMVVSVKRNQDFTQKWVRREKKLLKKKQKMPKHGIALKTTTIGTSNTILNILHKKKEK